MVITAIKVWVVVVHRAVWQAVTNFWRVCSFSVSSYNKVGDSTFSYTMVTTYQKDGIADLV